MQKVSDHQELKQFRVSGFLHFNKLVGNRSMELTRAASDFPLLSPSGIHPEPEYFARLGYQSLQRMIFWLDISSTLFRTCLCLRAFLCVPGKTHAIRPPETGVRGVLAFFFCAGDSPVLMRQTVYFSKRERKKNI